MQWCCRFQVKMAYSTCTWQAFGKFAISLKSAYGAVAVMLVLTGVTATACSSEPQQQYAITGTVQDVDGKPMPRCVILPTRWGWSPTEIGITTSSAGKFVWPGVPPGTYNVEARCSGLSPDGLDGATEIEVTDDDVEVQIVVQPSP
jgi:hypothetical protein